MVIIKHTLLSIVLISLASIGMAFGVHANSNLQWQSPTANSDCTQHQNCFWGERYVIFNATSDKQISNILIEANYNTGWVKIDELTGLNTTNYSYRKLVKFSDILGISSGNKEIALRASITDPDGTVTKSTDLKIDRAIPLIKVQSENGTAVTFTQDSDRYVQKLQLKEPKDGSVSGSGLNKLRYRVYNDLHNNNNWVLSNIGISGEITSLPNGFDGDWHTINQTFNLGKDLGEGYYWLEYSLDDNAILSEDNSGQATLFSSGTGSCVSDHGSNCLNPAGNSYSAEFYPLVIDKTLPDFSNFAFQGQTIENNTITWGANPTFSYTVTDQFSWLKGATLTLNGTNIPIPQNGLNLSANYSIALPQSALQTGTNYFTLCQSDYAGNERCASSFISVGIPTVTVNWQAKVSGKNVKFTSTVQPNYINVDSYHWDFGDGTTSNLENPTKIYAKPGTYKVKLIVTPAGWQTGDPLPSSSGQVKITKTGSTNGGSSANGGSTNSTGRVAGQSTEQNHNTLEFRFINPSPTILYLSDPVTFELSISPKLNFKSIKWELGAGYKETEEPILQFIYRKAGSFLVWASGRDQNGNLHSASIVVEVKGSGDDIDPNFNTSFVSLPLTGIISNPTYSYSLICCCFLLLFLWIIIIFLKQRRLISEMNDETVTESPMLKSKMQVQVKGNTYQLIPIKTHKILFGESIIKIVDKYAAAQLQPGDILCFSQKVIAICENSVVHISQVKPGFLAKLITKYVTKWPNDVGFERPEKMQVAINQAGYIRMVLAIVIGGLSKFLLGRRGDFYRIAGNKIAEIDGFNPKAMPPFDQYAMIPAADEQIVTEEVFTHTRIPSYIIDGNNINVKVVAMSRGFKELKLDKNDLRKLMLSNPMGQDDQLTPIFIIRKLANAA